jgi:rRNA-processing protein EBP2
MVKKFQKRVENEEDDLSDYEIDNLEENQEQEINDTDGLEKHLKRIKEEFNTLMKTKGKQVDWIETMDITSEIAVDPNLNLDDDMKRDLIFYNITLQNAAAGINKLKERNEKLNRPDDFFAEMIKSDNQMGKIKRQIVTEQTRIKKFEDRKQKMQNVKFSKAVLNLLNLD